MPVYHAEDRYSLVRIESEADWADLLLLAPHLQPKELAQFQELLGHSCKSIILERDYVCKDYRDTYTHYYSKKFATYPDKCTRLLFFYEAIEPEQWWDVPSYAAAFIGYTVIRPTRITSIGRTILDPKYCRGARGYICRTRYRANLMGTELLIDGFPHISQDTDVTICAHAACWSCCRYFSERYPTYREIHPYQITQLNTDLSGGRLLPSRGLMMYNVAEMFSRYGFYPRIYDRAEYENEDDPTTAGRFERLLYYYVESGLPVVVGIPEHAVTAIGHTCDLSLGFDSPGPVFTDHFLTGLVINDDNHMPYQTMLSEKHENLRSQWEHVSEYDTLDIDTFVVPLYEKVYLSAENVEAKTLALLALQGSPLGIAAKAPSLSIDDLVIRIFLTTSRAYKLERRISPLPHGLSQIYTQLPMPKFIWVSEIATRDTYAQGKIVGEILWDATASDKDQFAWLLIHYPEFFIANNRNSPVAGLMGETSLDPPEPYPLYSHNLHALL